MGEEGLGFRTGSGDRRGCHVKFRGRRTALGRRRGGGGTRSVRTASQSSGAIWELVGICFIIAVINNSLARPGIGQVLGSDGGERRTTIMTWICI